MVSGDTGGAMIVRKTQELCDDAFLNSWLSVSNASIADAPRRGI